MFELQRLKNWLKSSVNDDKNELIAYQSFTDILNSIDSKFEEYLEECGYNDQKLYITINNEKCPLDYLKILRDSVNHDKSLSIGEKAKQAAKLTTLYYEELKELKNKIIDLAVNTTDNVYLYQLNSSIKILNQLLKKYAYLKAIEEANIKVIDNIDSRASEKIKSLSDNIAIRSAEVNTRLSLENTSKRKF